MAVCNCHDFAAFPAFCRADSRAPFFAELKLASMNASLRSSFLDRVSPRPVSAASARGARSAATAENVDDRFGRADSDRADRARERRCAESTKRRSALRAYPATVATTVGPPLGTKPRIELRPLGVGKIQVVTLRSRRDECADKSGGVAQDASDVRVGY